MSFSSVRMCQNLDSKYNNKFQGWLTHHEREELKLKVRTIGGHIVFPAHKGMGSQLIKPVALTKKYVIGLT
ncbi:MAG: hypothetical protein IPM52_08590 [Bacteroidetes bacterium]|nr:hypothetical protein [Bacteroidota bacterium]